MMARQKQSMEPVVPQMRDVEPKQSFGHSDHSFTLQAIMELQKSNGQLSECINSLKGSIEKQEASVRLLGDKVSSMSHKIYAAGVVLAILLAVGTFVVDKAWDLMVARIEAPSKQ